MREMNAEETEQWAMERNDKLTPEEIEASRKAQERFKLLEGKGRIARAKGIVETPEVILEKMSNGIREVLTIPIDGKMLDLSLMAQSERLGALAEFFTGRNVKFPSVANGEIANILTAMQSRIEELRFSLLNEGVGKKSILLSFVEEMDDVIGKIKSLWDAEDGVSHG